MMRVSRWSLGLGCLLALGALLSCARSEYDWIREGEQQQEATTAVPPGEVAQQREAYRSLLTTDSPLQQVVWDHVLQEETVLWAGVLHEQLLIETQAHHLLAIDCSSGVMQWILELPGPLTYPPCVVAGKPQAVALGRQKLAQLKLELASEEGKAEPDHDRVEALVQQAREADQSLREDILGDLLYFTVGGDLYSVYRQSGAVKWTRHLPFSPSCPPCASPTRVFLGSREYGRFYELDALGGYPLHWLRVKGGAVEVAPVAEEEFVYFATSAGELYGLDFARDQLCGWSPLVTRGAISSGPTLSQGTLFVGSGDYSLYAVSAGSGTILWKYYAGGPVTRRPIVAGRTIYLYAEGKGLTALSAADGRPRWTLPEAVSFLTCGRVMREGTEPTTGERVPVHVIYVRAQGGMILGVDEYGDRKGGVRVISRFDASAFDFCVAATEGGILYFLTRDGQVFAASDTPAGH